MSVSVSPNPARASVRLSSSFTAAVLEPLELRGKRTAGQHAGDGGLFGLLVLRVFSGRIELPAQLAQFLVELLALLRRTLLGLARDGQCLLGRGLRLLGLLGRLDGLA